MSRRILLFVTVAAVMVMLLVAMAAPAFAAKPAGLDITCVDEDTANGFEGTYGPGFLTLLGKLIGQLRSKVLAATSVREARTI